MRPTVLCLLVAAGLSLSMRPFVHASTTSSAADDQKTSRDWKRLDAPGLTVIGNARAGDLRQTAEQIVRFRLTMKTILPALETDPPAPVVAIVFRDDNALTPFKPRDRGKPLDTVAAYFSPLPDVNYIVMAMGRVEFTYHVIFHEYTHLLVNQNIRRLPLWLNEGMADFYSTFDGSEHDSRLIVGRPILEYLSQLRGVGTLMPLSRFVDPKSLQNLYRDQQATSNFYAQSWALTHYLLLGDKQSHRRQLGAFMAGLQNGDASDVVFKRVFGEDLNALDRGLRQYLYLAQLPAIQVPTPDVKLDAQPVSLSEADAEQLQGDLLVRTGAFEAADKHLERALSLDRMHVGARLSHARSLIAQERPADAVDILSAPDLASLGDFPTAFLRAEANRAAHHFEDAEAAYQRAVTLRQDSAFIYYGLSLAQLALGKPDAAASFARAQLLQPSARWYYSRLLDSQRLGVDTFAVSDASSYVQQAGWQDGASPYALYIAALTLQRQQQADKATEVLESIRTHVDPASWQASVAMFLEGKSTADALLARASPDPLLTEAHAYIGIKAHIDGDAETAKKHLEWVRDKGRHDYTEYRLALGELDRMNHTAGVVH